VIPDSLPAPALLGSGCHVHVKSSYLKGNFLVVPEGLFHAKPSGSECRLQVKQFSPISN